MNRSWCFRSLNSSQKLVAIPTKRGTKRSEGGESGSGLDGSRSSILSAPLGVTPPPLSEPSSSSASSAARLRTDSVDAGVAPGLGSESGRTTSREGLCQVCDRDYPMWFAPNPLWNRVMREGVRANGDMYAFICPTCFANIADEQNGTPLTWTLFEDGKFEEYQREELRQAWTDKAELFSRAEALAKHLRDVGYPSLADNPDGAIGP